MWRFFIDRGGTFTDIVAQRPDGRLITLKLLSQSPHYEDAALEGIRRLLALPKGVQIPTSEVAEIRMGTTVGTNALLEKRGARVAFITTRGFGDGLLIDDQSRPDLFALKIEKPDPLYEMVVELDERLDAEGKVLKPLDEEEVQRKLWELKKQGVESLAIALLHSDRNPIHEEKVAQIAQELGFERISRSSEVSPLPKWTRRAQTTVVDAYLSPVVHRYRDKIRQGLEEGVKLLFMQSHGGLVEAQRFRGRDSLLSGPAGGVIAAIETAKRAGFEKIVTFDMGGTSTDVAHFAGELERKRESEMAGYKLQVPLLDIHTVAAGGGSILWFDGERLRVGPQSAGADPGPRCYRRGGPLTVTDANVLLGKIQPDFFPKVFGPEGNLPLDVEATRCAFVKLRDAIDPWRSPEEIAEGFLEVAVENMAAAIKKISIERGYRLDDHLLVGFGAAAGQHVCLVAEKLGIQKILLHPLAGVLSAYGMGLAALRELRRQGIEKPLTEETLIEVACLLDQMAQEALEALLEQGVAREIEVFRRLELRYRGSDTPLLIPFGTLEAIRECFERRHRERFGFLHESEELVVVTAIVEAVGRTEALADIPHPLSDRPPKPHTTVRFYSRGRWHEAPLYLRHDLRPGQKLHGPAMIIDGCNHRRSAGGQGPNATTVIEPGWQAEINAFGHLVLTQRSKSKPKRPKREADPILLELFHRRFSSIAEEMGYTLQNTAASVNIKERLDFSCALFDQEGRLVANAPHIPVHLGSMGEAVRSLRNRFSPKPGEVYLINSPYHGGTHLPDLTVVKPIFDPEGLQIRFWLAARGHHADIGGKTPGSMPAHSRTIDEEGVWTAGMAIVRADRFLEEEVLDWLRSGPYPARTPRQNLADLKAQIAAVQRGEQALNRLLDEWGWETVSAYMEHIRKNAAHAVERVLTRLQNGHFRYRLDSGAVISVKIEIDRLKKRAKIDFTGTSPQQPDNFNAPLAVTKAAALYVFRTLIDDEIPLNEGCLEPLEVIVPEGSLLNPRPPAAVVAGNVETSQYIVDALYGALGVLAASQGTMNNFSFGDGTHQYYETICGGAGAGDGFDGTSAVHTHMTNSRLTDVEILERRFPVRVERFEIRRGSGGLGRFRGGDGVVREIRFLKPMQVAILSSHRRFPPFGLKGGRPALCGRNLLLRQNGEIEELPGCAELSVQAGDRIWIETPGGGGSGRP